MHENAAENSRKAVKLSANIIYLVEIVMMNHRFAAQTKVTYLLSILVYYILNSISAGTNVCVFIKKTKFELFVVHCKCDTFVHRLCS